MPSPIAHGLAGLALTGVAQYVRLVAGQPSPLSRAGKPLPWTLLAAALMCAACLPDLDFVPGILIGRPDWLHRGPSHSLLGAAVFGAMAAALARAACVREPAVFGLLIGVAYASHVFLDTFSPDPLRITGVPAFWPLTDTPVVVPSSIFLEIRRDPRAGGFFASLWLPHNLQAVLREMLIMGTVLALSRLAVRARSGPPSREAGVRARLGREVDSQS